MTTIHQVASAPQVIHRRRDIEAEVSASALHLAKPVSKDHVFGGVSYDGTVGWICCDSTVQIIDIVSKSIVLAKTFDKKQACVKILFFYNLENILFCRMRAQWKIIPCVGHWPSIGGFGFGIGHSDQDCHVGKGDCLHDKLAKGIGRFSHVELGISLVLRLCRW